jgi:hypothetical protein
VTVKRDKKYLWYTTDTTGLEELLISLFSECCSSNQPFKTDDIQVVPLTGRMARYFVTTRIENESGTILPP